MYSHRLILAKDGKAAVRFIVAFEMNGFKSVEYHGQREMDSGKKTDCQEICYENLYSPSKNGSKTKQDTIAIKQQSLDVLVTSSGCTI